MNNRQQAPTTDLEEYLWRASIPIPASLLSRLSEAADGIRNGRAIYFVAQMEPDAEAGHAIIGYFTSVEEAFEHPKAQPRLLSGEYMIFGPFKTSDDPGYRKKPVREVVIYTKEGKALPLSGERFDCVFWSLSAIDKFVVPYYTASGNLKKAAKVRADFMKETAVAGIHIPGSDIVNDNSSTGFIPDELGDRVGLYLMKSDEAKEDPGIIFIPL